MSDKEYLGEAHYWTEDADGDPVWPKAKSTKDVQKWADKAMFKSEASDAGEGPTVYLLSAPADPLGSIAAAALMYEGKVIRDLAEVTDDQRRYYLGEMQKTKLKMPLEAVTFHFLIDNVTRAFTHQLVRQRTAAYAQESMRFAVVEDNFLDRVALPPSLAGTQQEYLMVQAAVEQDSEAGGGWPTSMWISALEEGWARMPQAERWRMKWDMVLENVQDAYTSLVNDGMPAEDARGLLPTNITTRVHYITNLRALLDHAGNRLSVQAQFEWRLMFAKLAMALRNHDDAYRTSKSYGNTKAITGNTSSWQYNAIADLLKPVCFQIGRCAFMADVDRYCSIRDRVEEHYRKGEPSSEWNDIQPYEWLADPGAAR